MSLNNESRIIVITLRLFKCTNMITGDTLCGTFSLSIQKTIAHKPQNTFRKGLFMLLAGQSRYIYNSF